MRWKLALSVSMAILFLSVGIAKVRGQEITATILGTVRDISGGTISGATITVTNEGTGVSRTVASDTNGDYLVSLLLVGVYTVKVEKSGFATYVQKGIQLVVNQNARIDTSLKPGGVDQSVTVEANAAQLETSVATIGKVMEEKSVRGEWTANPGKCFSRGRRAEQRPVLHLEQFEAPAGFHPGVQDSDEFLYA